MLRRHVVSEMWWAWWKTRLIVRRIYVLRCETFAKPFSCGLAYDLYWLGHVPCRIVKLVGLVVGIQIYEKKILYTSMFEAIYSHSFWLYISAVDDGTGVVDCVHSQVKPKVNRQNISKYQPVVKDEPVPPPEPIAEIGQSVEAIGRVKPYHDSWQIVLSQIG